MASVIASNLSYLGAFKLGLDSQSSLGAADNFDSTTAAIAFNPSNGRMFIAGSAAYAGSQAQKVGEFPIPALVLGSNISLLNEIKRADATQAFVDPFNGTVQNILTPAGYDTQGNYIRGMHVVGSELLINVDGFYTSGNQSYSVFKRPLNLASTSGVVGPSAIATPKVRMSSGGMSDVPIKIQQAQGILPVVATQPLASIQGEFSFGKPVSAFNPASIGNLTDVVEQALVRYARQGFTNVGMEPTLLGGAIASAPDASQTQNDYYNWTTKVKGIVWPEGYDSVLVFAYHGMGLFWYGAGDGTHSSGLIDPNNNNGGNAPHAPPYVLRCWVYKAKDLIDVKNGIRAYDSFLPVSFFDLPDPFVRADAYNAGGGVTYDRVNRKIYISRAGQNYFSAIGTSTAVVLAFQLAEPTTPIIWSNPLVLTGASSANGTALAPIANGAPSIAYSLSGAYPSGVTVNAATGIITWPIGTAAGTYNFNLVATGSGGADIQPVVLTITGASVAPTITSAAIVTLPSGTTPSYTATATGTAPIVFSIAPSVAGWSINASTGVVTGPILTANQSITIVATNGVAPPASQVVSFTVSALPQLVINGLPSTTVTGNTYPITVTANGVAVAGAAITIDGNQVGVTTSLGQFNLVMPAIGFAIPVYADKVGYNQALQVINITAFPVGPTITSAASWTGTHGQVNTFTHIATSGTPPYVWSISIAPAGATINPSTGVVTFPASIP